jgi:hypothetical protein
MAIKKTDDSIDVVEIRQGRIVCNVLGRTPLVLNAMSAKIKQGLLSPQKKNAAEKASSLKHNPIEEYRATAYKAAEGPTRIIFPAVSFKAALPTRRRICPARRRPRSGGSRTSRATRSTFTASRRCG